MDLFLFILKKAVTAFALPPGCLVLLGSLGVFIWVKRPNSGAGKIITLLALALLLILSLPITAVVVNQPLEEIAGQYADPAELRAKKINYIVVLGGGVYSGDRNVQDLPGLSTSRRLLEGVRLAKALPGTKLVLSGGALPGKPSEAKALAGLAMALGIKRERLILEDNSWDTADQAGAMKKLVGERPFALVTSARHMMRSMALMKRKGLNPLPAPTDFIAKGHELSYETFLPRANALARSSAALHEYLGLLWNQLSDSTGQRPSQ